jgi:hypothetical protein
VAFSVRPGLDDSASGPDHELIYAISIEIDSEFLAAPTGRSSVGRKGNGRVRDARAPSLHAASVRR